MSDPSTSRALTDDSDLLARSAGGDVDAFDRFVERHAPSVLRYLGGLTVDQNSAEEALQTCFVDAWRNAATFRGASARAWLISIARHALFRSTRPTRSRPPEVSLSELGEAAGFGADTGSDTIAAVDARDAVERALARLDPSDREIIILRELEDIPPPELARILELSLAATKSRLHRARLRFVAALHAEDSHGT